MYQTSETIIHCVEREAPCRIFALGMNGHQHRASDIGSGAYNSPYSETSSSRFPKDPVESSPLVSVFLYDIVSRVCGQSSHRWKCILTSKTLVQVIWCSSQAWLSFSWCHAYCQPSLVIHSQAQKNSQRPVTMPQASILCLFAHGGSAELDLDTVLGMKTFTLHASIRRQNPCWRAKHHILQQHHRHKYSISGIASPVMTVTLNGHSETSTGLGMGRSHQFHGLRN